MVDPQMEEMFAGLTVPQRLALYQPLYPQAVELKKGGREVCSSSKKGRQEYAHRRRFLFAVYDEKCVLHGGLIPESGATLEHPAGRGMGGSIRDDSVMHCLIACYPCQGRKGSRPLASGEQCPFCGHGYVVGAKRGSRECFRCNGVWSA